ncbi:DUF6923 family protein, partial [Brucella intermedia]
MIYFCSLGDTIFRLARFRYRLDTLARVREACVFHETKVVLLRALAGSFAFALAVFLWSGVSQAQTFPACSTTMYLSQYGGGWTGTRLFRIDTSTNPMTYPVLGTGSPSYNATGYNPLDNLLYAMQAEDASSNYLVRIRPDGSVTSLGPIAGMPNLTGVAFAGEIGPDGTYYVFQQGQLFHINIASRQVIRQVTVSSGINPADIGWHNGALYGVSSGNLYRINPSTGAATDLGPTGIPGGTAVGAMFGTPSAVYGSANDGNFFKFDLLTGAATLISGSPATTGNDGAKCVNSEIEFPVDLSITKDDGSATYRAGTDTVYMMIVTNNGPFGVQNALVNDPLPAGITASSWECGNATGGAVCRVSNGTGSIENVSVNIPVGGSVTFKSTVTIPSDFTGDLVNTATVTAPAGSPDTNIGNNSASDTDIPANLGLTIEKTGTLNDADGDGL